MSIESPVEFRRIGDMALLRVLCDAAPSEDILGSLRDVLAESGVDKTVLVLEKLRGVDTTLSSFLSGVDEALAGVHQPVIVFESSGFFETLAGLRRPYLFSRDESDTLDRVSAEFLASAPVEDRTDGKVRILIIEDDPDVMEFLEDLLATEERFEVRTATSGFEGGLATACFRPHLILLDIMLPDIDGRDVCRILRRNENVGAPKIIAITALSRQKDVSEIMSVGVDDYLGKPFRINVLLRKIDRLLAREDEERTQP